MDVGRSPRKPMGILLLLLLAHPGAAAEPPDLTQIARSIAREPAYTCERPLYGLYVFGRDAQTRVWAVLDKSRPDAVAYDVLYFDRNADGDLTAADERIVGEVGGAATTFDVGTFADTRAGQTHSEIAVRVDANREMSVMLHLKWCGEVDVRGGYAPVSGPYTKFASSKEEAPILWPCAEGVFSFQFWMVAPLKIGEESDVRVFVGHAGVGANTFCAVPDTFLPLTVPVWATLVYTDASGAERTARSELRQRC